MQHRILAKFPDASFVIALDEPNQYQGGNMIVSKNGKQLFKKPFERVSPYPSQIRNIENDYPDCKVEIVRHLVPIDVSGIIAVLGNGTVKTERVVNSNYIHWWANLPYGLADKLSKRHIKKPALFLSKENIKTVYDLQKAI